MKLSTLLTAAFVSQAIAEETKTSSTKLSTTTTTTTKSTVATTKSTVATEASTSTSKPKECGDYKTCFGCYTNNECKFCAVRPAEVTSTTAAPTEKPPVFFQLLTGVCQKMSDECSTENATVIKPEEQICMAASCDECMEEAGMVWKKTTKEGQDTYTCVASSACQNQEGAEGKETIVCIEQCSKNETGAASKVVLAGGVIAASAFALLF